MKSNLDATNRGYAMGRCYYPYNPHLTLFHLLRVISTLKIPTCIDAPSYKLAFYAGYRDVLYKETGTLLPDLEKDDYNMASKFELALAATEKAMPRVPYAKIKDLIKYKSVFCLQLIGTAKGINGLQHKLVIKVDDVTAKKIETAGDSQCAVTLTMEQGSKRDLFFSKLEKTCPHHMLQFKAIKLEGGTSFYDLVENKDAEVCACGYAHDEEEEIAPEPEDATLIAIDHEQVETANNGGSNEDGSTITTTSKRVQRHN